MLIIKFIVFISSFVGYASWAKLKFKIHERLVYLQVIAIESLLLYFGALLNILPIVAYVLYAGGLVLLIQVIWRNRRQQWWLKILRMDTIGLLMAFFAISYFMGLWQLTLVHYDNFTHWATIVKFLVLENHLPTAQDLIISYNTYPVGSALFLYFIAKMVGYHDGILMIGQFIVIASALYSLFGVLRDKERIMPVSLILASFGIISYYNMPVRYNNLLVDALIALIALGAMSAIYAYQHQPKRLSIHVSTVLSLLMLVKTSAVFFVIVIFLYYIVAMMRMIRRFKLSWRAWLLTVGALVVPFGVLYSWQLHVKYVIGTAASTKHAVGSQSIMEVLRGHLSPTMLEIIHKFFETVFNWQTRSSQQLVILFGSYVIFTLFYGLKFHSWRTNVQQLLLLLTMTILYYFGNLMMFLTAMPVNEAVEVAGYDRYLSTLIIFVLGMLIITLVRQIDFAFYEQRFVHRDYRSYKSFLNKRLYQYTTILALFYYFGSTNSDISGMNYVERMSEPIVTHQFKQIIGDRNLTKGKYLVVSADETNVNNYYLSYVAKYMLWNADVDVVYDFVMSDEDFKNFVTRYDGVILLDDHYVFNEMAKKLLLQQLNDSSDSQRQQQLQQEYEHLLDKAQAPGYYEFVKVK